MSGPAVTAERHGRKSMLCRGEGWVVRAKESPGGRACWGGSMAHLTPACPLLNQARPLTPLTRSPARQWGSPAARKWVCTVRCNHLWWFVDVLSGRVVTKWGKLTFHAPILRLCVCGLKLAVWKWDKVAKSRGNRNKQRGSVSNGEKLDISCIRALIFLYLFI